MKGWLILGIVLLFTLALGVGYWYLSSSFGGSGGVVGLTWTKTSDGWRVNDPLCGIGKPDYMRTECMSHCSSAGLDSPQEFKVIDKCEFIEGYEKTCTLDNIEECGLTLQTAPNGEPVWCGSSSTAYDIQGATIYKYCIIA